MFTPSQSSLQLAIIHWQSLWAIAAAFIVFALIITWHILRNRKKSSQVNSNKPRAEVYSLTEDLNTEHTSRLFHLWQLLNKYALGLLIATLCVVLILLGRPMSVEEGSENTSHKDIVLCLDVSGSTLPYDREVINTYIKLVNSFQGERIALSIFNSTSRTVFPLTDDYSLVTSQLKKASTILQGVQSQDSIDKMNDQNYQDISDWLDGTQNRSDATSLIGDGLVSCAALLPGFTYSAQNQRSGSIVLATDNVVSGEPTYTLTQALDLIKKANIIVDGLYSGPQSSLNNQTTIEMRNQIQSHGGVFLSQAQNVSVEQLVKQIERRKDNLENQNAKATLIDNSSIATLALSILITLWLILAWRLKR
ncbi:MAG: VWA domain-containing protein [Bifidobacteriaceae bacterium]|nr:VWA domain-containing protein [Bifidobacteriaceae bacterium]